MTRDEILRNEYSAQGLVKATNEGFLFDYVAQWYYQMSKHEIKEVLLAVLGVGYDSCKGDEDEEAYAQKIVDELAERGFGNED